MEFLSHPDKKLYDHLKKVGNKSKEKILKLDLNLKLFSKTELADIAYLMGIFHDFGKIDQTFQEFIKNPQDNKNKHNPHAEVSSYILFLILNKYFEKNRNKSLFSYFFAYLIKKHHGNLDYFLNCPLDNSDNFDCFNFEKIKDQLNDFKKQHLLDKAEKEIYSDLLNGFTFKLSDIFKDLENEKEVLFHHNKVLKELNNLEEDDKLELFLVGELLFSILIDYDKKDATNIISYSVSEIEINPEIINNYIKYKLDLKKQDQDLITLKNKFFEEVTYNETIEYSNKFYTITAPTGIGKTLTALSAAINLRNKISESYKKNYKIIYILPYTSIIDQNYEQIKTILRDHFKTIFDDKELDYIIKHHYLSEDNSQKIEFKDYLTYQLWISSWESNIIVSTYVQLLYSLIGNQKNFLNKFHNIINSIIILDEVQFIPIKYRELVKNLFSILGERFNTYFFLITATQPIIFENQKSIELANNYFENQIFDRVKLNLDYIDKSIDLNEFKSCFEKVFKEKKPERILIILNTVACARKFYEMIETDFSKEYAMYYLSTDLLYIHRKKAIEQIKEKLKNHEKYICVSTQLIEAGVDISSDLCFRDIAPLDSLIQSSGRCNRNNECISKGNFYIIKLKNEKNQLFSKFIYDSRLLSETTEILKKVRDKNIKDLFGCVSTFFENLKNYQHANKLMDEGIKKLNYKSVKDEFKLIEDEVYKIPVYIVWDNKAEEYLKEYLNLLENKNMETFERVGKLKKCLKDMQRYTLDLNKSEYNKIKDKIEEIGKINIIPKKYRDIYSEQKGINLDGLNNVF